MPTIASLADTIAHPIRWTHAEREEAPVTLEGELPEWLRGRLLRTAPALFSTGRFRAEHWFDGFGMLYAFELGERPRFRQRLLRSRALEDAERGGLSVASFATDTQRSLLSRILRPLPRITDNANVNVVPWREGEWLAMTESPFQHRVDPESLESLGLERYEDRLPKLLGMTAHPQLDRDRKEVVNLGSKLGPRSEILVYRQALGSRARIVEARLPFKRVPYVHSFGFSPRHVVLMDHPLRVNPAGMIFRNTAYAKHFRWEPEEGARLWKIERASGEATPYECRPFFCFHVINQFEDGEDVVLDFLGFDDASVIWALTPESFAEGTPPVTARPLRARLSPRRSSVELEPLSELAFEFPTVDFSRSAGKPYRSAWGAALGHGEGGGSTLLRLDLERGEAITHGEPGVTYGEPVFVGDPGASAPEEGVILSVGTREGEDASFLRVLDAQRLEPVAKLTIDLTLPLGFHGSFARAG